MARTHRNVFYWLLWIVFWFLSKRWEILVIEWPTRSSQLPGGDRGAGDMAAAWVEKWRVPIARAALYNLQERLYSAQGKRGKHWGTLMKSENGGLVMKKTMSETDGKYWWCWGNRRTHMHNEINRTIHNPNASNRRHRALGAGGLSHQPRLSLSLHETGIQNQTPHWQPISLCWRGHLSNFPPMVNFPSPGPVKVGK